MDVLQVKNSNGHVGTEDQYEQDEVSEVYNDQCCNLERIPPFSPREVFKHEDDAHHVEDQEEQLHHHPVQSLPLDLIYFSLNIPAQT